MQDDPTKLRGAFMSVLVAVLAVCVLGAAVAKKRHAVSIEEMKFVPSSVEVSVGDTVEWTNNDERDHTVKGKDFASGNLGGGRKFSHTFKKAGKYAYNCSLHPRMKGTVVVSE